MDKSIEGKRIKLIKWGSKGYSALLMTPGKTGTVAFVDDKGTVHVDWDNGGRLGLIPSVDRWEIIDETTTE